MKALIVVDVQKDFCPSGALAVTAGDKVVAPLNELADFARRNTDWLIVASRDWHPENSRHFKINRNDGKGWPVHCVQDTNGAEFHSELNRAGALIFSKGMGIDEDAYSAFDGIRYGGGDLDEVFTLFKVHEVYVGGLATDYCVRATVLDALKKGYKTILLIDAIRAVDLKQGDGDRAIAEMVAAGAILETTKEVIHELDN